MRQRLFMIFALVLQFVCSQVQVTVTRNGKPTSRIVILDETEENKTAATLLQDFVHRITKSQLPITTQNQSSALKKGDIVIANDNALPEVEDAFKLNTRNGQLYVINRGGKGAIYGVVTLLEKYADVHYYAANTYTLKPTPTLTFPQLNEEDAPAFRYRASNGYEADEDPIFKLWFRLEAPEEIFIDRMWVHTFNRLLPSDVYGKEHPEYYSFINGERRPGNHSQWCLSNPEVFDIVAARLDSIFQANPSLKTISVSQNDGNDTYCTCPLCKAIDEEEGAHSGSIIRFMNRLAERFPDKEISTLAYLYSMQPPRHVKPLPNVNIMLCDIDCRREVPLTDNESGRYFLKALKGWSEISNNIFVWDYGTNFDNQVSPFPNFHILKPNIKLFKEHHATMHFSQINTIRGGDFNEMRTYMVAKLMWNPDLDADSLMQDFMRGYYGEKATPYLYQYQKIMQGALLASGQPLWIYDSPVSHKNGMLNTALLKVYDDLFDRAEKAASEETDTAYLHHVRASRLSLQYAELELARTEPDGDKDKTFQLLNLFEERTKLYGVTTLNERGNAPDAYCKIYRKRFLPQSVPSKALNAKVEMLIQPNERYVELGKTALTDGLYGGTSFNESWVGWIGTDIDFIVDLGEEKEFTTIETDFLHHLGAWILLPKGGKYSISIDKKNFTPFGSFSFEEDRDITVKFVPGTSTAASPVRARYIRLQVEGLGLCPSWHYGVGYPACHFIDEIEVH